MSCDNAQKQIILRVMNPTSHDIELPVNKFFASVSDIHHDNVYLLDDLILQKAVLMLFIYTYLQMPIYRKKNIDFEISSKNISRIVSEYIQEIPQSQTADNPVAPQGRAAQPSRDTRKTN